VIGVAEVLAASTITALVMVLQRFIIVFTTVRHWNLLGAAELVH
jgi:hypothetical protein